MKNDLQPIEWGVIAKATCISIIILIVIGFGWGLVGLLLYAAFGQPRVDAVLSAALPIAYIVGFLAALIPVIVGVLYLHNSVDRDVQKHCIMFGAVFLILHLGYSIVTGDFDYGLHGVLYLIAVIPTAIITSRIVSE